MDLLDQLLRKRALGDLPADLRTSEGGSVSSSQASSVLKVNRIVGSPSFEGNGLRAPFPYEWDLRRDSVGNLRDSLRFLAELDRLMRRQQLPHLSGASAKSAPPHEDLADTPSSLASHAPCIALVRPRLLQLRGHRYDRMLPNFASRTQGRTISVMGRPCQYTRGHERVGGPLARDPAVAIRSTRFDPAAEGATPATTATRAAW